MQYPNLFKPLKVGKIYLKNRIVASPIGGDRLTISYTMENLAAKARGGAGLIVLGSVHVDNDRSLMNNTFARGLYDPHLPYYCEQLSIIHQYGLKASVELIHCGLWARLPDKSPIGPVRMIRNIGKDADGVYVEAMDERMMEEVAENYAKSALTAKSLGFDMCMLHFAHGWLPAQFLSPLFNKRTDKYGGSFENRIRFPMMIVNKVREYVGPDYPIDMRISGKEWIDGGIDTEEVIKFVSLIEDKIDMIHVSSGIDKFMSTTAHMITSCLEPHLLNIELAEAMKKAVKIPVVTVGGITMPEEAEKVISDGKADAVSLGRALFADPDWPNKARTGHDRDIVPCLRCISCYHVATQHRSMGCAVNPRWGREARLNTEEKPASCKKRVVVIGGGPGGMKAAITAAERGHEVILIEKEKELGGIIKIAQYSKLKIDLQNYKNYLVNKTINSAITIKLNTEATPDMVRKLNPDAIIVAVGSKVRKPPIPGIDLPIVLNALDAYKNLEKLGSRVVIIGGGQAGCELGLEIAGMGKETTLIEMTDTLARDGNLIYRESLRQKIESEQNLTCIIEAKCKNFTLKGVTFTDKNGDEKFVEADNVICATGMEPLKELAESFHGIVYDTRSIGDCISPRRVNEATHEGYFASLFL